MAPASTASPPSEALPHLRFDVPEAARILRMSRAQLYLRIQDGSIRPQKDGARTYLTQVELERYVRKCARKASRNRGATPAGASESPSARP